LRYGAIDIGSNAVRLLIAEVIEKKGKARIIKTALVRVPVRLGDSVFTTGKISPIRIKKLSKTMEAFRLLMEVHGVEQHLCYATSAMRESLNAKEVVEKVRKDSAISIEIIDGRKEAKLIQSTFETIALDFSKTYLYIDVGGGSTEISLLEDGKPVRSKSFPLGTVRLLKGKVDVKVWKEILDFAKVNGDGENVIAIGSGGNINKLIKLSDSPKQSREMNLEQLQGITGSLEKMSVSKRMDVYDLRVDRADVIVPAGEIYKRVMEAAEIDSIVVPKVGLSDGMVYSMYKRRKRLRP